MSKLNESQIIDIFASHLGISELDDIALVQSANLKPGGRIAFKCDMLVASTDVPPTMSPEQVARKSIVACVSDFASKGIRPLAAMVALALSQDVELGYVEALARGFAGASREFGVRIVGGDTNGIAGGETVIDCSMIGIASGVPKRGGAGPGDVIVVSGPFGYQSAGLRILMKGARSDERFKKKAIQSVLEPFPAVEFGRTLSKYFSSSMDSSDGLAISLYTIAKQSRVDMMIETLPPADGLLEFARVNSYNEDELALFGGEEYEIVCTIPRSRLAAAVRTAKSKGIKLIQIGRVVKGSGNVVYNGKVIERKGYDHFTR